MGGGGTPGVHLFIYLFIFIYLFLFYFFFLQKQGNLLILAETEGIWLCVGSQGVLLFFLAKGWYSLNWKFLAPHPPGTFMNGCQYYQAQKHLSTHNLGTKSTVQSLSYYLDGSIMVEMWSHFLNLWTMANCRFYHGWTEVPFHKRMVDNGQRVVRPMAIFYMVEPWLIMINYANIVEILPDNSSLLKE